MSKAKSKFLNVKTKVTDKADKAKKSFDSWLEEWLKKMVDLVAKFREIKASYQKEAMQMKTKLESHKTEGLKFIENFKTKAGMELSGAQKK